MDRMEFTRIQSMHTLLAIQHTLPIDPHRNSTIQILPPVLHCRVMPYLQAFVKIALAIGL
jgi:hypothetical protein